MAMNRVAESYSTQNKRNEKLRWRARRDETYKNNGLNFFLKEHFYFYALAFSQDNLKYS